MKLGRNEPCWCGSGQKYKRCHFAADRTDRGDHHIQGGDTSIDVVALWHSLGASTDTEAAEAIIETLTRHSGCPLIAGKTVEEVLALAAADTATLARLDRRVVQVLLHTRETVAAHVAADAGENVQEVYRVMAELVAAGALAELPSGAWVVLQPEPVRQGPAGDR